MTMQSVCASRVHEVEVIAKPKRVFEHQRHRHRREKCPLTSANMLDYRVTCSLVVLLF